MRLTRVQDRGPFEEPPVADKVSVDAGNAKSVMKVAAWIVAILTGITLLGEREAVVSAVDGITKFFTEWARDMVSW